MITAGVPFGTPGSTNLLRIAWVLIDAGAAEPRKVASNLLVSGRARMYLVRFAGRDRP